MKKEIRTDILFYTASFIAVLLIAFSWHVWYKSTTFEKYALNRFKNDSTKIVNLQNYLLDVSKERNYYKAMFFEAVKCKSITETMSYKNAKIK
jgi:hypothetical protein